MNNDSNVRSAASIVFCGENSNEQFTEKLNAELIFLSRGKGLILNLDVDDTVPEWITPYQNIVLNIIWPSKGLLVFNALITYVLGHRVHIDDIAYVGTIQRRRDLKVSFSGIGTLSDETTGFVSSVKFNNISAGGIGFTMPDITDSQRFVISNDFNLRFTFDEKNMYDTSIHILRADLGKDGKMHCGAQFYNQNAKFETELRSFIFKKQLNISPEERYMRNHSVEIDILMKSDAGYDESSKYKK